MKKELKFLLVFGIILVLFSVQVFSTQESNKIKIISGEDKMNVVKSTGIESQNYDILKNSTNVCFVEKDKKSDGKINLKVYTSENKASSVILNKIKNKDGVYQSCISTKNLKYLQLGENTTILLNQTEKSVQFDLDLFSVVKATLYKNISGDFNNTVNSVFVNFNENKWKFGAVDNYSNGWEQYKYVIRSIRKITVPSESNVAVIGNYNLDLKDICTKQLTNTTKTWKTFFWNNTLYGKYEYNTTILANASCKFNSYSKEGYNYLEVVFYSDKLIDPEYSLIIDGEAHWKMNEQTGYGLVDSISGHDCTLQGSSADVLNTTGKINGAINNIYDVTYTCNGGGIPALGCTCSDGSFNSGYCDSWDYTDEGTCIANIPCTWDSGMSNCYLTQTGCSDFNSGDCNSNAVTGCGNVGCTNSYNAQCSGNGDEGSCNTYAPPCSWDVASASYDYAVCDASTIWNTAPFTISFWTKGTAHSGHWLGMQSTCTDCWRIEAGNYPYFVTDNIVTAQATTNFNDGNWHMATATMNETGFIQWYTDAKLESTFQATAVDGSSDTMELWKVGGDGATPQTLDDVRFFKGVLSQNQISRIYAGGTGTESEFYFNSTAFDITLNSTLVTEQHYSFLDFENSYLKGWWRGEGNALDSSGNGYTGTWSASEAYTTGLFNSSFDLAGTNKIDLGNLNTKREFTLSMWVNASDLSGNYRAVFAQRAGCGNMNMQLYAKDSTDCGGNYPMAYLQTSASYLLCGTQELNAGQWYHLVQTYDGTQLKLYIDGVLDSNMTAYGNFVTDVTSTLGDDSCGNYFDGKIDDVIFLDRAISADEVLALNASSNLYTKEFIAPSYTGTTSIGNAVLHYTMNDNEASTNVIDSSGHQNGTSTGSVNTNTINATGKINGALDFSGNIIDTQDTFGTLENFSVSTWFNSDTTGSVNGVFSNGGSGQFHTMYFASYHASFGGMYYAWHDSNLAVEQYFSIGATTNGVWHHIAITKDGTLMSIYYDGKLMASKTTTATLATPTYNVILGQDGYGNAFDGRIDDFRIYDYGLSAGAIANIYNRNFGSENETFGTYEYQATGYAVNNSGYTYTNTSFTNYSVEGATINLTVILGAPPADTTKPLIQFVNPTNSSGISTAIGTIKVNVTATDETALANITINLYNSTHSLINSTNTTTSPLYFEFVNLPDGIYFYNATAYDTSSNFNDTETRNITVAIPPVCTLISRTPTNIIDNSTGILSVIMNCTDASGINITKVGDHYPFFITRTVDAFILSAGIPNYWSNRYPNNSLGVVGSLTPPYKIWRALGRNEGYWYDSLTGSGLSDCTGLSPCYAPLNDTFSYAIEDGDYGHLTVTPTDGTNTSVIINYTHPAVDISAFRQSIYLSYESMVQEGKKNYTIENNKPVLMKRFDAEAYRGTQNYTMNLFRDFGVVNTPTKTLRSFYCNSSYNPAGSTQVISSPNCALINSLTATEINNRIMTDRNSSYSKGTYGIINGRFGGIVATSEFYIEYESPQTSASAYYQIRYVNETTNTDVSFNDTKVAWTSINGGTTWTQALWTPDVMTTTTRSANDEFQFGLYVTDNFGNAYKNFTFFTDEITLTNHPISFPLVLEYNSTNNPMNIELNGTYKGLMTVRIGVAKDPDSVGNVTHNLSLFNVDGTFNKTINGSFLAPLDAPIWINFDTTTTTDGTYRMNILATAGDNLADTENRTTDRNFTIDNTAPYFTTIPANQSVNYGNGLGVLFVGTDAIGFDSYKLGNWTSKFSINSTGFLKNTSSLSAGEYIINVTINDSVGNTNMTWYNLTVKRITNTPFLKLNNTIGDLVLVYPNQVNASASCTFGSPILYRNAVDKTSENNVFVTLGVNNYTYESYCAENENYTAVALDRYVNITQATLTGALTSTKGWTYNYDNLATTIAYSESNLGDADVVYKVYRDNVDKGIGEIVNLASGTYAYKLNSTGGENYSTSSSIHSNNLVINQISSQTSLTFDKTSPQVYGNTITPTCSILIGETMTLTLTNGTSGVPETLGVNNWTINCSYPGNVNYSASSNFTYFNITQATPILTFLANGGTSNLTLNSPNTVNLSAKTTGGSVGLDKDGSDYLANNSLDIILPVGSYLFRANVSGNQNYSDLGYSYYTIIINSANTGGGSSGGGSTPLSSNETVNLCKKTLDYIQTYTNIDYTHFSQLKNQIYYETNKTYSETLLQDYVMNWQSRCSDKINRTLEENYVCTKSYYFLTEKGKNYSIDDFFYFSTLVNGKITISDNLLKLYLKDYNSLCSNLNGLSLPFDISDIKITEVLKIDSETCSPEISGDFWNLSWDFMNIGYNNLTCEDLDRWKFFVKFNQNDYGLTLVGIKVWLIGAISLFFVFFFLVKTRKDLKKMNMFHQIQLNSKFS